MIVLKSETTANKLAYFPFKLVNDESYQILINCRFMNLHLCYDLWSFLVTNELFIDLCLTFKYPKTHKAGLLKKLSFYVIGKENESGETLSKWKILCIDRRFEIASSQPRTCSH